MLFESMLIILAIGISIFGIGVPAVKIVKTLLPAKKDPLTEAQERLEIGCPKCITPFKEELVRKILESITNEKWESCRLSWNLNPKTGRKLQLDGYCANLKMAFEYDGEQHFKIMRYDKTPQNLQKRQYLDAIKNVNCINNNIKLIRIPYTIKTFELEDFIKNELNKNNFTIK